MDIPLHTWVIMDRKSTLLTGLKKKNGTIEDILVTAPASNLKALHVTYGVRVFSVFLWCHMEY